MQTTLNADGLINIPKEIRDADQLVSGQSFEVQRLSPGHYLLKKQPAVEKKYRIVIGEDGLPIVKGTGRVITTELVKEIEALPW